MNNAIEMGCEYVIVSSHLGARMSDDPVANHYGWQGQVYKINGSDDKYKNLFEATGFDYTRKNSNPLGLFGYNCRHSIFPYWLGDSNPFKKYGKEENKEAYERNKRKREFERKKRKLKTAVKAYDKAIENCKVPATKMELQMRRDIARELLKKKNEEYKAISEKMAGNNLPRKYVDNRNIGNVISREELSKFIKTADEKGIRVGVEDNPTGGFETYRGEPEVLYQILENAHKSKERMKLLTGKDSDIIIKYDNVLDYNGDKSKIDIEAFAVTRGRTITFNKFMYDDTEYMKKQYNELEKQGFFVKGTSYRNVVDHEIGHIINRMNPSIYSKIINIVEKEANSKNIQYIQENISIYASIDTNDGIFNELIAEINAALSENNKYVYDLCRKAGVNI